MCQYGLLGRLESCELQFSEIPQRIHQIIHIFRHRQPYFIFIAAWCHGGQKFYRIQRFKNPECGITIKFPEVIFILIIIMFRIIRKPEWRQTLSQKELPAAHHSEQRIYIQLFRKRSHQHYSVLDQKRFRFTFQVPSVLRDLNMTRFTKLRNR